MAITLNIGADPLVVHDTCVNEAYTLVRELRNLYIDIKLSQNVKQLPYVLAKPLIDMEIVTDNLYNQLLFLRRMTDGDITYAENVLQS